MTRGTKGAIGVDGTYVYLAIVTSATVTESAYVLQALGARDALNLDGGGTSALYSPVGTGRSAGFSQRDRPDEALAALGGAFVGTGFYCRSRSRRAAASRPRRSRIARWNASVRPRARPRCAPPPRASGEA